MHVHMHVNSKMLLQVASYPLLVIRLTAAQGILSA